MRLLHLVSSMNPQEGGPVQFIHQCMAATPHHRSCVVSLDAPQAPWIAHQVQKKIPLTGWKKYGCVPGLVSWLRQAKKNFASLVVHGLWQYLGRAAWQTCHSLPYTLFPHGMLDPWMAKAFPFKHKKKKLSWQFVARRILQDAHAIFFTAEEEKERARQIFPHYPQGHHLVVGAKLETPPLKEAQEAFLSHSPQLNHRRFFLYLGRLHPKKAPELLPHAFEKVHSSTDAFLVIKGTGNSTYCQNLQSQIPSWIQPRVVWTGPLEGKLNWGAYASCYYFVLLSHQENFCFASVEALSCRKP